MEDRQSRIAWQTINEVSKRKAKSQSKTESCKTTRKNKTVETALQKPTRKPIESNT